MASVAPIIVITGPTGSGKSSLALELAERHMGEIICADSRTVYTGMDIGTAKPSPAERARVRHHMLDVATPDQRFTVHDFQQLAVAAIDDIRARGRVPFLVGGTGLYIDSVVLGYDLGSDDYEHRQQLSTKSNEELIMMLKEQHLAVPSNHKNKRHLVSALIAAGKEQKQRTSPQENAVVVAIATEKTELEKRLAQRAEKMLSDGLLAEAQRLSDEYGWDSEAMTGNVYPILKELIAGRISQEEAIEKMVIRDRQLAKRQVTWLNRHDYVRWMTPPGAHDYLEGLLASYS